MVGQPGQGQQFGADWIEKASPDDLIEQGTMIFSKLGQLDQTHRERFATELRADPNAARLIEEVARTTA